MSPVRMLAVIPGWSTASAWANLDRQKALHLDSAGHRRKNFHGRKGIDHGVQIPQILGPGHKPLQFVAEPEVQDIYIWHPLPVTKVVGISGCRDPLLDPDAAS